MRSAFGSIRSKPPRPRDPVNSTGHGLEGLSESHSAARTRLRSIEEGQYESRPVNVRDRNALAQGFLVHMPSGGSGSSPPTPMPCRSTTMDSRPHDHQRIPANNDTHRPLEGAQDGGSCCVRCACTSKLASWAQSCSPLHIWRCSKHPSTGPTRQAADLQMRGDGCTGT